MLEHAFANAIYPPYIRFDTVQDRVSFWPMPRYIILPHVHNGLPHELYPGHLAGKRIRGYWAEGQECSKRDGRRFQ